MPDLNTDLLYRTLDRVIAEDQRGNWDQRFWINKAHVVVQNCGCDDCSDCDRDDQVNERKTAAAKDTGQWCGTTCCFAGWALVEAGGKIAASGYDITFDGVPVNAVGAAAGRLLGLSDYQQQRLFAGSNALDDVKHLVDQIVAGEIA